jgi:hypothetical protein
MVFTRIRQARSGTDVQPPAPQPDAQAIDYAAPSFDMLVEAYFACRPQVRQHGDAESSYAHYRQVLRRFQEHHGNITNLYYCSQVKAGAARTDKDRDEIFLSCHAINAALDPTHVSEGLTRIDLEPEIELLLFRCKLLHTKTIRLLSGEDRRQCAGMCYAIIVHLLDLADCPQSAPENQADAHDGANAIRFLGQELNRAARYQAEAAERRAQLLYFKGMLMGVGVMFVVLGCVALPAVLHYHPGFLAAQLNVHAGNAADPVAALFASLSAGALGAVVSVMARMSAGKCVLDCEAGEHIIVRLGTFRPIIGAIFGLVVFSMLAGGVLPIKQQNIFFYGALAFFAGFSERFAQDILALGQSRLMGQLSATADQPDQPDQPSAPPTMRLRRLDTRTRLRRANNSLMTSDDEQHVEEDPPTPQGA